MLLIGHKTNRSNYLNLTVSHSYPFPKSPGPKITALLFWISENSGISSGSWVSRNMNYSITICFAVHLHTYKTKIKSDLINEFSVQFQIGQRSNHDKL